MTQAMEHWEYRVVRGVQTIDEADLSRMGVDGWELAGVHSANGTAELVFKRPSETAAALEPLAKEPNAEPALR